MSERLQKLHLKLTICAVVDLAQTTRSSNESDWVLSA
jgi:hypothetical protein